MSVQARLAAMRPHQVFLVDGLGALVSTLLLGIMMVRFESIFGMPARRLEPLGDELLRRRDCGGGRSGAV